MNKLNQKHIVILAVIVVVIILGFMILKNKLDGSKSVEVDRGDIVLNENEDGTKSMKATGPINVVIKTNKGDIELLLHGDKAPITVGNFIELARGDFYDNTKFHRVIKNFMIQGGDPWTKDDALVAKWGTGGSGVKIQDEFVAGLSNMRGTISMANSGPNSGSSQWFINLVDNVNLDFDKFPPESKHPVFGKVIAGMEIVDAIGAVETGEQDRPVKPVIILDIVIK